MRCRKVGIGSLLIGLCMLICNSGMAQPQNWATSYGNSTDGEYIIDMYVNSDGSVLNVVNQGPERYSLVYLDSSGALQNVYSFQDDPNNSSYTFFSGKTFRRANGELWMVGSVVSGSNFYGWLAKLDPQGNIIWDSIYTMQVLGNPFILFFADVYESSDGYLYVAGGRAQETSGNTECAMLFKFDTLGQLVAQIPVFCTAPAGAPRLIRLIMLNNGDVIVTGEYYDPGLSFGAWVSVVARIDVTNNSVVWTQKLWYWHNQFSMDLELRIYDIIELSSGNLVAVGYTGHSAISKYFPAILVIDPSTGSVTQDLVINVSNSTSVNRVVDVEELPSGNVLVAIEDKEYVDANDNGGLLLAEVDPANVTVVTAAGYDHPLTGANNDALSNSHYARIKYHAGTGKIYVAANFGTGNGDILNFRTSDIANFGCNAFAINQLAGLPNASNISLQTGTAPQVPANITFQVVNPQGATINFQPYNVSYSQTGWTPIVTLASLQNVSCNGGSDGAINTNVIGMQGANYGYSWTGPNNFTANTQNISNIGAGTYTVTVTEPAITGCQSTASFTVTEPPAISIQGTVTDVSCNGGSDGAIDITVSGGTGPYSFSWTDANNNPIANTEDVSGLSAGQYTVTVTDGNGCQQTATFTVNQPPAISIQLNSITHVSCNGGSDGAIDITVSGGTGPYTYTWTDANNNPIAVTEDVSNLPAGTYTVWVVDANGCTQSASFTVNEPTAITIQGNVTDASCNGSQDGAINITVSGGTAPYSYSWTGPNNFSATTQNISNLDPGTYTVTVTDNNGCTATAQFTVGATVNITVQANVTDVSCNGGSDGAIDITVSGGTGPYTFSWTDANNNQIATTEDISGVPAGAYTVTVTDANGCTQTATFTVNEPSAIFVQDSIVDVSCNGGSDGEIYITVSGGTGPYTFSWTDANNNQIATTEDISGVPAGTYTVTVTDANGCTYTASFNVNEPPALSVSISVQNGDLIASASGGTPPYQYQWSNGDNDSVVTNASAGTYVVTVVDANGCTAQDSITITGMAMASMKSCSVNGTSHVLRLLCEAPVDAIIVRDIEGRTIHHISGLNGDNVTIDMSNVPVGIYLIGIQTDNEVKWYRWAKTSR